MDTFRRPAPVRRVLIATALASICLGAGAAWGAEDIEPLDPAPPNASYTLPQMSTAMIIRVKFNNGYTPSTCELRKPNNTTVLDFDFFATSVTNQQYGSHYIYNLDVSGDYTDAWLYIRGEKFVPTGDPNDPYDVVNVQKSFKVDIDDPNN